MPISPVPLNDGTQFDVLANEESKMQGGRSRKDDIKEQAYQAREGVKSRATDLKEQVVASDLYSSVSSQLASGIEQVKSKVANLTGDQSIKEKSNEQLAKDASNKAKELQDEAAGEWETVKRRGKQQARKAGEQAEDAINQNLTKEQKAQLNKAGRQVKQGAARAERQARGFYGRLMSQPQLRSINGFIRRNNLQLPAMILGSILTIWLGLSLIRLFTASPEPEFDIHSMENTKHWLKFHAGDYQNRAVDMKDSLAARAAAFLANRHELDNLRNSAVDWQKIGMEKLGLSEPTFKEKMWAYLTGRPLTWQGRVESVLSLARKGISAQAGMQAKAIKGGIKLGSDYVSDSVKDKLGIHHPTMTERITNYVTGRHPEEETLAARARHGASGISGRVGEVVDSIREHIPGMAHPEPVEPEGLYDSLKHKLADGVDSIRSHIPGGSDAAMEAAKQRAYAATHQSTLDRVKANAEYVKNRIVHGAQEAAHIAQDRSNEAMDKAKLRTGL